MSTETGGEGRESMKLRKIYSIHWRLNVIDILLWLFFFCALFSRHSADDDDDEPPLFGLFCVLLCCVTWLLAFFSPYAAVFSLPPECTHLAELLIQPLPVCCGPSTERDECRAENVEENCVGGKSRMWDEVKNSIFFCETELLSWFSETAVGSFEFSISHFLDDDFRLHSLASFSLERWFRWCRAAVSLLALSRLVAVNFVAWGWHKNFKSISFSVKKFPSLNFLVNFTLLPLSIHAQAAEAKMILQLMVNWGAPTQQQPGERKRRQKINFKLQRSEFFLLRFSLCRCVVLLASHSVFSALFSAVFFLLHTKFSLCYCRRRRCSSTWNES